MDGASRGRIKLHSTNQISICISLYVMKLVIWGKFEGPLVVNTANQS